MYFCFKRYNVKKEKKMAKIGQAISKIMWVIQIALFCILPFIIIACWIVSAIKGGNLTEDGGWWCGCGGVIFGIALVNVLFIISRDDY